MVGWLSPTRQKIAISIRPKIDRNRHARVGKMYSIFAFAMNF